MKYSPQKNTVTHESEHWVNQGSGFDLNGFHWDLLRFFLSVAETGSFRGAADQLEVSVNGVRKRIDDLEHQLNSVLFVRSNAGIELTNEGRAIYDVAKEISENFSQLKLLGAKKSSEAVGIVRLGVTEGLGSFWLASQIPDFLDANPNVKLDLKCKMEIQDVSRTDCHLTVQLEKPRDPSLIVKKLGYLHFMLYGTDKYFQDHGLIKSIAQIPEHRIVHIVADQIPANFMEDHIKNDPLYKSIRVITNTSSAMAYMIRSGATLGILPTYASVLSDTIVPIPMPFEFKRPIWLVYSKEMMRMRRVRRVADWVIDAFDGRKYPWFREEFVPPQEFST